MKRPDFTREQEDWICWAIGEWYLTWKDKIVVNEKEHRLGHAKEILKACLFPLQGKFLFRPHKGAFDESMAEVFEIESVEDIKKKYPEIDPEKLGFVWYGFDSRNMWNTFIVFHAGEMLGFTNGQLEGYNDDDDQVEAIKTSIGILKMHGVGLEADTKKEDREDEIKKKTEE